MQEKVNSVHRYAVCHPLFGRWVGKGLVPTQRLGFWAQPSLVSENCCEHVTGVEVQLEPQDTEFNLCQQIQLQAQLMASCTKNHPHRPFPSVLS